MTRILLVAFVLCIALSSRSYARKLFFDTQKSPAPVIAPAVKPPPPVTDMITTIKLKYADPTEVSATISGIAKEGVQCSANKDLNLIVLRGNPEAVAKLQSLIADLDVPVYDVMFDAKIAVREISSKEYDNYMSNAAKKLGTGPQDALSPIIITGSADDLMSKIDLGGYSSKKFLAAGKRMTALKIADDENTLISVLPTVNTDGTVSVTAASVPGSPYGKDVTLNSGQSILITSIFPKKIMQMPASSGMFNMFGSKPSEKEILRAYVLVLTPNVVPQETTSRP